MADKMTLTRASLRTPRAAAIAGLVFSILSIAIFWMLRTSFPPDPLHALAALNERSSTIVFALNLVPFSGIAFLWFIAVLRDRIGHFEDRFFATVFFGSGLLFLATFFTAAAVIAAAFAAPHAMPDQSTDPGLFAFSRRLAFDLMNVYALKMAAVFMLSGSTVIASTATMPRYLAYFGWALGLFILFGSQFLDWSFLAFPTWVLLLSAQILVDNFVARRPNNQMQAGEAADG